MGCYKSKAIEPKVENSKHYFKISIINPKSGQTIDFKYFDDKVRSETLINIMNNLCFGDNLMDKIDGNFISIYDDRDKRFHYYVHRLLGVEIEDPKCPANGKMWVCYINDKKEDWDFIIECNHQISKDDHITWKYEYFRNPDHEGNY